MSTIMAVLLNGIAELEYDRNKILPDYQAAYLDKMDMQMDEGIQIGEELIARPDLNQRAQFISANLVHSIKTNDEPKAAALCTYLAVRIPDLKQVKIEDRDGEVSVELVFDQEYRKQVAVQLTSLH